MLPLDVKEFIEKNIDRITNAEFESLFYDALHANDGVRNVGQVTEALLQAGIDPLDSITSVPSLYLDGALYIRHLSVPQHVKNIKNVGFGFSALESIDLHPMCELSTACFRNSDKLGSIKIPDIMNEVPEECFYGCTGLKHVDLAQVEQIASEAFAHCVSLKEIVIPDCIEYISDSAFYAAPYVCFVVSADNEYAIRYAQENNIELKVVDRV